ncbi:MAG: hypothetical protein R3E56_14770 [Burkholderiaceae bacterium]
MARGQNLLMALAVVALLALVVPLTLTGYATFNDWGDVLGGEALEALHEFLGNTLLLVVLAHVALVIGLSLLRRKNQACPCSPGACRGRAGPGETQPRVVGVAAAGGGAGLWRLGVAAIAPWIGADRRVCGRCAWPHRPPPRR